MSHDQLWVCLVLRYTRSLPLQYIVAAACICNSDRHPGLQVHTVALALASDEMTTVLDAAAAAHQPRSDDDFMRPHNIQSNKPVLDCFKPTGTSTAYIN